MSITITLIIVASFSIGYCVARRMGDENLRQAFKFIGERDPELLIAYVKQLQRNIKAYETNKEIKE